MTDGMVTPSRSEERSWQSKVHLTKGLDGVNRADLQPHLRRPDHLLLVPPELSRVPPTRRGNTAGGLRLCERDQGLLSRPSSRRLTYLDLISSGFAVVALSAKAEVWLAGSLCIIDRQSAQQT